ncbi:MAG: class I SAM-dependent RNA methyltransferase, partial [Stackebrandtia sp.]
GGHCVARADGRVIFVRHALPGERVRISITERKKSYWRADAVEILTASADRVSPPCRFAGRCGGCDFQHVSADGQRRLKTDVLREQLTRLGGLAPDEVAEVTVEPLPGGLRQWRTRMQYAVGRDGRPGLRAHRSHEVIRVDECVIADPRIRAANVLRRNWSGSQVVGVVAADQDELSVYTQRDRRGKARVVSGPSQANQIVSGHWFGLDPEGFWQVHPLAADVLAATVTESAAPADGETVWDLYAGAGLFSAVLADEVGPRGKVLAVETDSRGHTAANLADLPQAEARIGDVADLLPDLPSPDVVVLDPPRSGAGASVVAGIVAAQPRAVVYVACDPAALGRDLRDFTAAGYRLTTLRAFDAFPMTQHFETVALLTAP